MKKQKVSNFFYIHPIRLKNPLTLIQRISIGIIIVIPLNAFSATDSEKATQTTPPFDTSFISTSVQDGNPMFPFPSEYKLLNGNSSPIIANWEKQNNRKFPKELWNTIYNIKKKLLSNETNKNARRAIRSLWSEFKKKLLSDNLTILQIIAFLRDKISKDEINPYKKNITIQFIGELFLQYPVLQPEQLQPEQLQPEQLQPEQLQPELLETMNILQEQLSIENVNSYIKVTIIKVMGELLEKYHMPETELLQALNQLKENLFHKNIYIQQAAILVVGKLMQTSKVPDTEKRNVIFWVVDQSDSEKAVDKISSLEILNTFLEWNILSDSLSPNDIKIIAFKIIAFKIIDQIESPYWRVQKAAIIASGNLLTHENILLDPNDRRTIAFKIADQVTNINWAVREAAIIIAGTFINHENILSDPNDKKTIVFMITDRITDDSTSWKNKKVAIKVLTASLNQGILSQSEISKIAHKMIDLIDDIQQPNRTRKAVSRMINIFLLNDFLSDSKKLKIVDVLAEKLPASSAKARIINGLKAAKEAGVPLSFDVIYNIVQTVFELYPERQAAEVLVREYLQETTVLSHEESAEKALIYFELDQQLSKRELAIQQYANNTTGCEESMSANSNSAQ